MDPVLAPGTGIVSSSAKLRFDGRVAIVTGAGHGLGKAYALLLANRGCKVLVNDLGGSVSGDGSSSRAADDVVSEIRRNGGIAAPSYASVVDGARVVKDALDAFGRIDIVINNAGILRDGSFQKMSDKQWELVMAVHLQGAYAVARAAWPHMREQRYGRVIFVCSSTGLYGNFGQANYGAAKMGVLGMAHSLALEGRRRGILVNTVAPIAASRMTEGLMPPELMRALAPEAVAPVVAVLAHERCPCDDSCVEVGAGWVAAVRWQRSAGALVKLPASGGGSGSGADGACAVEAVAKAWDDVMDFERAGASHPTSTQESFEPLLTAVSALEEEARGAGGKGSGGRGGAGAPETGEGAEEAALGGASSSRPTGLALGDAAAGPHAAPTEARAAFRLLHDGRCPGLPVLAGGRAGESDEVQVARAIAAALPTTTAKYDWKQSALYALAVGASRDPKDPMDLAYTYENADTESITPGAGLAAPAVLPTQAVLFPHAALEGVVGHPGLDFNPMMLLHGQHELVMPIDPDTGLARPLPPEATCLVRGRVSRVFDKGSGALVVADSVAAEAKSGQVLAINRAGLFLRGIGGFAAGARSKGEGLDAGRPAWQLPGGVQPAPGNSVASPSTETRPETALLYRLLGDLNPLHADPAVAGAAGFERPILHGLCSLGVAGRHVITSLLGGDPRRLLRIRGRFSRHVLPGQTLQTHVWIAGDAQEEDVPGEGLEGMFPRDHGASCRSGQRAKRVLFEVSAGGGMGSSTVVLSKGEAVVVLPSGAARAKL